MTRLLHRMFLIALFGVAGGVAGSEMPAAPIPIFVSVLPQKYFVERIGGDRVQVSVMVGPGQSPATYQPTAKQMSQLERARLFFRIGVPFEEAWMERIQAMHPDMSIVDGREGIELRRIRPARGIGSEPGHDHRHTAAHKGEHADPHVWTSPPLVKIMAVRIRDALTELDPAYREVYASNYRRFVDDLDGLDSEIRSLLEGGKLRRFLVFHPSWGYFADTYGLEQLSVESEGKQPGAKTLAKVIDFARQERIRVVFVQKQFSRRDAETVARAIGGRVVAVDPLAENYLENLSVVARAFAEVVL